MPSKPSLRMRTWGTRFDTLPTSPPLSPPMPDIQPVSQDATEHTSTDITLKRKEEKMPHDASVFVGSLPSNIDQQELTRLLAQHLSEHTEVKNIKVVRDSKGGVCAFVQCEDAAAATSLINTLHSMTPRQFLGRNLRYEPARAFRALLISYRTPMQHIPGHSLDNTSTKPQAVELNLPSAMRIWRSVNSKYYSLLYNNEAVDAENYARNDLNVAATNPSLFLHPVPFDEEAIKTIASYFGPLENFNRLSLTKDVADPASIDVIEDWKLYPIPHDAPRSAKMDTCCWEIKWEHRDDCVSALMTLRRVPHLTVTWAHQPSPFGSDLRSPYMPLASGNLAQYPFHVQQEQSQPNRARVLPATDPLSFSTLGKAREISQPSSERAAISEAGSQNDAAYLEDDLDDSTSVRWSDMDFPPLSDANRSSKVGVWNERQSGNARSRSASLSLSLTPGSRFGYESDNRELSQELDMPPTPALGRSPLTPKTPGFPPTPTTGYSVQNLPSKEVSEKDVSFNGDFSRRDREIDPTTLFVGGLETFGPGAWDEAKLTKFFGRFGGLEDVKIVRPLNSHAAFAFVRFNNTEAPARAVFEEHNRVYEGRPMRVQLRDCNHQRGVWRHRGRVQTFQPKFDSHRRRPSSHEKLLEGRGSSQDGRRSDDENQLVKPSGELPMELETRDPDSLVYTESVVSKSKEELNDSTEPTQISSTEATASSSSPSTPFTSISTQPSENYREWYDESLSAAPSLSASLNSSASAPASAPTVSYPLPGTYFSAPWVSPYGPPVPFPVPFVGFPPYPLPGQPQIHPQFPRPVGAEGNVAAVPGAWPPIGMYGSYIPYPAQPPRTPTVDTSSSQQGLNNRAPLAPTGFIQNDQGTLIAVYQPEALDQYMSNGQVVPPALQHSLSSVSNWTSYSQPPVYPTAPPTVSVPGRQALPSSSNMTWIHTQGFLPQQQQHATPHPPQNPHSNIPNFRGVSTDNGGQPGAPSFRRHQGRSRDQSGPQNNQARNSHPRSFQNRNARGNMFMGSAYHGHNDGQSGPRNVHLGSPTEWGPWNPNASGPR